MSLTVSLFMRCDLNNVSSRSRLEELLIYYSGGERRRNLSDLFLMYLLMRPLKLV